MIGQHNSRRWRVLFAITTIASLCAVILAWNSWRAAEHEREGAVSAHKSVGHQVEELARLRAESALVEDRPRPGDTIVEPIRAELARLGMSSSVLTDLTTSPPSPIADSPYSRQRIALTLSPLEVGQLARFLDAWRRGQPLWTVSAIAADRLQQQRHNDSNVAPDSRFTVHLTLENVFLSSASSPGEDSE